MTDVSLVFFNDKKAFILLGLTSAFLIKICPLSFNVVNLSHFRLLPQNHESNFNQTWHTASLEEGDSKWLNDGPAPFYADLITKQRKYNDESHFQPNLTENIHSWKGFKFCSNEGPRPFPKGDSNEIAKIHWKSSVEGKLSLYNQRGDCYFFLNQCLV